MGTAARRFNQLSVAEYLEGELVAEVRHEYVGGQAHAMAGTTINHGRVAGNVFAALHASLAGKPCQPYNSDIKVRVVVSPGDTRFYYPDVSVVCESNPPDDVYQDRPVMVVEVLSPSTRRLDDGEKRDAYLTIPALGAYLLAEQDAPAVKLYRRVGDAFKAETYEGGDAVIELPEIGTRLAMADVYRGVSPPVEGV
ncbi:MAG: Uma2 family endonuclease [Planctomycetota bacterium]